MDSSWTGRTADWVRPPIAVVARLAGELRAQGADLIDLGQAILGLPPPAAAMQGVRAYLEEPGPHVYSPDPGLPALREAIARMLVHHKHIPGARGDGVMVTCGANQAFANALVTVTCPGDEVITFDPGYFDHGYTIRMAGCTEVPVALPVRDDRYTFDLDAVAAAMTDRTRAVVLVSPGNPTGAVAPRVFIEGLCSLCRNRGVWVLSDETYDLLTFSPAQHCSPASVDPDGRVIVLGSFSKILGMAGWRVGYLYGSDRVIEEAYKVQDALVVCAPVVSQRAVLATLDHLDAYVNEAREELARRRDTLLSSLEGWTAVRPRVGDGATFLLARLEGQSDDVSFCQRLLREAGIVTVPGSAFGEQGKGTIRLSFGNQPCERLREAGQRMRGFV
jgi:aspartate/methionine/tyrosine aminotransferase